MKIISKISLIIIFISLIGYIQPVDANHFNTLLGYHDEIYKIHLQTIIRDKDNQLVSVIESTATNRLPTYLPDGVPVPQLIDAMIDLAQSEPGIPILPKSLDTDPWLLNVLNGTLDLRTGKLRAHERDDLITKQTPVEYDSQAQSPQWESFLYQIMAGCRFSAPYARSVRHEAKY